MVFIGHWMSIYLLDGLLFLCCHLRSLQIPKAHQVSDQHVDEDDHEDHNYDDEKEGFVESGHSELNEFHFLFQFHNFFFFRSI